LTRYARRRLTGLQAHTYPTTLVPSSSLRRGWSPGRASYAANTSAGVPTEEPTSLARIARETPRRRSRRGAAADRFPRRDERDLRRVLREAQRDAVDRLAHLFEPDERVRRMTTKCGQNCGQGRLL
jgi:hypothetical protein